MFAGRPRNKLDSALVRLETADGTIAWGESYCVQPQALTAIFDSLVVPLALGRDAEDETLLPGIQRTLHNLGRSGPVVHALAGFDIALWDLRAKRAGVPLYQLLGGKQRDKIRVYASLLQYYGDSARLERVISQALQQGYTEIKLHERTADALAVARRAAGPNVPIMVDTNCAWTLGMADAAIAEMAQYSPFWIEEPLWPPENDQALAQLQQSCGIPLAVGENASSSYDLERIINNKSAQYVQPSVIKLGLTAALHLSRHSNNSPVVCAPQVAFFGPGYLASLHLIAAQQTEVSLERLYVELVHEPYANTVPIDTGWVDVPDTPGLGAEPESALVEGLFGQ